MDPKRDMLRFQTRLKLKVNSEFGLVYICISPEDELDDNLQEIVLSRKVVLPNVMKVFDTIGLRSPLILKAKLLPRETWNIEGLGWNDSLPEKEKNEWLRVLRSLIELSDILIPRSLWPEGEVEE